MKTSQRLALALAAVLTLLPAARAAEAPTAHWYAFCVTVGDTSQIFYGSSVLDESALLDKLAGSTFLIVTDRIYLYKDQPKEWTEWSRYETARVLVNPKNVAYVIPLRDDPRKVAPTPVK